MISIAVLRRAPETLLVAGVVACIAVVAWVMWDLWPHPTPLPPREQYTADSLAATKPDYRQHRDTLFRIDSAAVRQSRQSARRATEALRRADSLHCVAIQAEARSRAATDSLLALAQARLTITALVGETASLRTAVAQQDSALRSQIAAHAAADQRANAAEQRLASVESLNARLAGDLQRSTPPCRIAWVLGCPSRRVSFVAGSVVAIAGVVAAKELTR